MTNPSPHRYLDREAETAVLARLARYNVTGFDEAGSDRPPRGLPGDALSDVSLAVEFGKDSALQRPAGDEITADDVVDALRLVPGERFRLEYTECGLIEAAMNRGLTWEMLASRLGYTSKQAIQQRYRRLGGHKTWAPDRPRPITGKDQHAPAAGDTAAG